MGSNNLFLAATLCYSITELDEDFSRFHYGSRLRLLNVRNVMCPGARLENLCGDCRCVFDDSGTKQHRTETSKNAFNRRK